MRDTKLTGCGVLGVEGFKVFRGFRGLGFRGLGFKVWGFRICWGVGVYEPLLSG